MGGEQSTPATNNQNKIQPSQVTNITTNTNTSNTYDSEQEYFIVQQVNKIKLKGASQDIYYWIDPRIYNEENGKNLKVFKQNLIIEEFSSIGSLQNQLANLDAIASIKVISAASLPDQNYKYMNQQKRINEIILFCQNQERATLLMKNFPKIVAVGYTSTQVVQIIKKNPVKEIKFTALFMGEQDMNLMNKYRLNYYCLTNQVNKNKAKKQFMSLAKKLYPDQKDIIQEFDKSYSLELTGQQRRNQTINWIFKNSFYWDLVQNLPKITTDPRRLAYLRTPVKDIYDCIYHGYKQLKKKPTDLYIVVQLNEQEKQKLAQSQKSFLIFTTFIKGFTTQGQANKQFKNRGPNAFIFQIMQAKKLHQPLDFGFIQRNQKQYPDVVFNIYNFFQVFQVSLNTRRGTLQYGSLAQIFKMRLDPKARGKIEPYQKDLLRNYDYFEDLMKKVKNQGNILQLSGFYKQSIKIYDKKLEQITRTNKPATMLDQYRISKGDAYRMSQQYALAEKSYQQVQTQKLKLVAKVKLIELFFARSNFKRAQQIINQIEMDIQKLKDWGFSQEYFRAKNYFGLNLMKKQKFNEANSYYKQLRLEISDFYQYRIEGIPLVHQIYQNMALSQTKVNKHEEALNLLNSTKSWQQSSCGRGPTLLATQKMIQGVYVSKGDNVGIQQSKQRIQKISLNQSEIAIFIDASNGAAKIQNSIQQSIVNIDLDASNPTKKNVNIEQSAINIDI